MKTVKKKHPVKRLQVLTRRTKRLLDSVLLDDSVLVPESQLQDAPPVSGTPSEQDISVIPETQQSQADLFSVTLVSEDGSSDTSSLCLPGDEDDCVPMVSSDVPDVSFANLIEPPDLFADVGVPIETVTSQRYATPVSNKNSLHLFRGPKNPLSAFYLQKLQWNSKCFISAEQAYQYKKLLFHRVPRTGCNRLLKCRSSHDVKRIANELVPSPTDSWNDIKFNLMTEICEAKVRQCKKFRDTLTQTGSSTLIHNTETDSVWGCGVDMKGRNMMGKILMQVRDNIQTYQMEYPPLPPPSVPNVRSTPLPHDNAVRTNKPASVIVIGNSNTRGLAKEINARGLDCTGFVYPGQTAANIKNRVENISNAVPPSAVVCHAGDIEVHDRFRSTESIKRDYTHLINKVRTQFPKSRIVISGLPPPRSSRDSPLHARIQEVNRHLTSLCTSIVNCVFLSNAKSRLKDNIHFTNRSKDILARSIAGHVKQYL